MVEFSEEGENILSYDFFSKIIKKSAYIFRLNLSDKIYFPKIIGVPVLFFLPPFKTVENIKALEISNDTLQHIESLRLFLSVSEALEHYVQPIHLKTNITLIHGSQGMPVLQKNGILSLKIQIEESNKYMIINIYNFNLFIQKNIDFNKVLILDSDNDIKINISWIMSNLIKE